MLTRALTDLAAWTNHLREADIPIFQSTATELAVLAQAEAQHGDVDALRLAEPIARDPLMALKLMAFVSRRRRDSGTARASMGTGPETVVAALVMCGIGPFFEAFSQPRTVEQALCDDRDALSGLQRVVRRAHRASHFALGFAVHRMDDDAPVLHLAALLSDFAEMLLWCQAPSLALEICMRQADDPRLRSAVAQREVLNVTLAELEQSLMRAWSLPELLVRLTDGAHARDPQVRTVELAVRLARHTQDGWHNAALADDIEDLSQLLGLSVQAAHALARELDA
jgi:HD-like signal output (HDOD) protein